MKGNAKFLPVSVLILVLLAGLSGCLPAQKAGLDDQQVASVTENILKGLDANNYPAFTHDFSCYYFFIEKPCAGWPSQTTIPQLPARRSRM